jgi:hypothetical protein
VTRVRFADDGPPEADLTEGPPEIFCATLEIEIQSDLAFELDAEKAAADQAKRAVPHTPAADDESSDDESPPAEPIDPPVEELPVFSHQGGPISWLLVSLLTATCVWRQLALVLLVPVA